jgi:hypothetical protein
MRWRLVAPVDLRSSHFVVSSPGGGIDELGLVGESGAVGVRGGVAGKLRDRQILAVGGKADVLNSASRIWILCVDLTNVAVAKHNHGSCTVLGNHPADVSPVAAEWQQFLEGCCIG